MEENHHKRQRTARVVAGRTSKRKLGRETYAVSIITQITETEEEETDLAVAIRRHVEVLNSSFSDAGDVKGAAAALSSLAKTGTVLLRVDRFVLQLSESMPICDSTLRLNCSSSD